MGGQGREKGSVNKIPRKPSLEVGSTYGIWTILEYEGPKHRYPGDSRKDQFWKCKCSLCNRIESRTTALLKGFPNGCRCKLIVADASFHKAFRTYRRQATVRSLSFELTLDDFKRIVTQNCIYCGQEPALNSYSIDSKIRIPMNGIDRKDSDLSYTIDNCIPCCGVCNKAKLDYSVEDFLKWADKLASFRRNRVVSTLEAIVTEGIQKPDEEWETELGNGDFA